MSGYLISADDMQALSRMQFRRTLARALMLALAMPLLTATLLLVSGAPLKPGGTTWLWGVLTIGALVELCGGAILMIERRRAAAIVGRLEKATG